MPEPTPAATDLDSRLAEIDDALKEIQAALVPDGAPPLGGPPAPAPEPEPDAAPEPEPEAAEPEAPEREPEAAEREPEPPAPPEPEPPPPPPRERRIRSAQGRHGPLEELLRRTPREHRARPAPLDALAELTDVQLELLASSRHLLDVYLKVLEGLREPSAAGGPAELTLDVGPFAALGSVRAFEAALATLPGVIEVSVRGYEGSDRAIIDVQLNS